MKNFKMNAAALLTAGTMILSMTGCGKSKENDKKSSILQGTLLEQTIVANVDGDISVLRPQNSIMASEYSVIEHEHFFDIVNGQWITDDKENCNKGMVIHVDSIEKIGSVSSYLTQEEMIKAKDDELTEDDVISIIYRIKESEQENQVAKTK